MDLVDPARFNGMSVRSGSKVTMGDTSVFSVFRTEATVGRTERRLPRGSLWG